MRKDAVIYKATNIINNKVYIGQTTQALCDRKNQHVHDTKKGCDFHFHRAIRRNGLDNFKWEIIRICNNLDELNAFEQYYIIYYDSFSENGYNMTSGGENYVRSEKSKEKMRIAALNMSDIHKKRIRQSNLGNHHTEESKQKMRDNRPDVKGENHPMFGRRHSKETLKKMSVAHLNMSEETKLKMSIAKSGRKLSKETKLKISKSKKRYFANKRGIK